MKCRIPRDFEPQRTTVRRQSAPLERETKTHKPRPFSQYCNLKLHKKLTHRLLRDKAASGNVTMTDLIMRSVKGMFVSASAAWASARTTTAKMAGGCGWIGAELNMQCLNECIQAI